MLTHNGIIFAERHLFGDVARVLLGDIEKASVSSAEQLDLDRGWLRHGPFLRVRISLKTAAAMTRPVHRRAPLRIRAPKVKP